MAFKSYSKQDQIGQKKEKNKSKSKKQAPVAKIRYEQEYWVNDLQVDSESDLFLLIYKNSNKKSFLSGKKIYSPESRGMGLFVGQFAHVLSKAKDKYPYFKLYSKNIVLLTNQEHTLLDHGTEDQRKRYADEHGCDWSKIDLIREILKEEYESLIKKV